MHQAGNRLVREMQATQNEQEVTTVMVATEGLTCRFGELIAVDGLTLSVRAGEVFGLLGPTQVITLSVFDTPARAEASIRSAADWVLHHLAQLTSGVPEIKRWEVKIHVSRPNYPEAHTRH